jgi:hypothetical protein
MPKYAYIVEIRFQWWIDWQWFDIEADTDEQAKKLGMIEAKKQLPNKRISRVRVNKIEQLENACN